MAPEIGTILIRRDSPDSQLFLTVNLIDSEKLDAKKFDEEVLKLSGLDGSKGLAYQTKYIACGDVMYIFPAYALDHYSAVIALWEQGISGNLQSAGFLEGYREGNKFTRFINGTSQALWRTKLLSTIESDYYKKSVIKKSLGEYFEVK